MQPNDTRHYVAFNDKLRSKGQTEEQCRQARRAMAIYYRSVGAIQQSTVNKPVQRDVEDQVNVTSKEAHQVLTARAFTPPPALTPIAGKAGALVSEELKSTGASWMEIYGRLESAIKVRHYSVKTWQAYRHWLTAFQTFTKSKDPRLLAMDDVKGFLSFLAVEKHVAASSQNQAFNALLFLFKNILGKDF